jgi:hypothetical protein
MLIEQTDHTKFLGVTIQHNFSWEKHIKQVGNRLSQINSVLSRVKGMLPKRTLESIYRSLAEPYIMYGTIAWGNAPNKYLKRLNIKYFKSDPFGILIKLHITVTLIQYFEQKKFLSLMTFSI